MFTKKEEVNRVELNGVPALDIPDQLDRTGGSPKDPPELPPPPRTVEQLRAAYDGAYKVARENKRIALDYRYLVRSLKRWLEANVTIPGDAVEGTTKVPAN